MKMKIFNYFKESNRKKYFHQRDYSKLELLKFTKSIKIRFTMVSITSPTFARKGSSSSGLFFLFFVILVCLGAFATNPTSVEHKLILKDKMREYLNTEIDKMQLENDNKFAALGASLGAAFGGIIVDKYIDENVVVDDYYLFSITNVRWEGKIKMVGLGIFGKVVLHPDIDKKLKEGLTKIIDYE